MQDWHSDSRRWLTMSLAVTLMACHHPEQTRPAPAGAAAVVRPAPEKVEAPPASSPTAPALTPASQPTPPASPPTAPTSLAMSAPNSEAPPQNMTASEKSEAL